MKTTKAFLFLALFALGITTSVYSGGNQNSVPEMGPFRQDSDEIGYEHIHNYYTGESYDEYRELRL